MEVDCIQYSLYVQTQHFKLYYPQFRNCFGFHISHFRDECRGIVTLEFFTIKLICQISQNLIDEDRKIPTFKHLNIS